MEYPDLFVFRPVVGQSLIDIRNLQEQLATRAREADFTFDVMRQPHVSIAKGELKSVQTTSDLAKIKRLAPRSSHRELTPHTAQDAIKFLGRVAGRASISLLLGDDEALATEHRYFTERLYGSNGTVYRPHVTLGRTTFEALNAGLLDDFSQVPDSIALDPVKLAPRDKAHQYVKSVPITPGRFPRKLGAVLQRAIGQ